MVQAGGRVPNASWSVGPRLLVAALVGVLGGCGLIDEVLRTPRPTTNEDPGAWGWIASAQDHRGADGEIFEYVCPPGGHPGPIWGTDVYTDDSSVCTAAVHAGLFPLDEGGRVRIVIRTGRDSYTGSTRNGMISEDYGHWDGSFSFVVS